MIKFYLKIFPFLAFTVLISLFTSCKNDLKEKELILKIRIAEEPDCLHPVVSQSSLATQIEVLIMPPLFEYHPDKLELSPMLVRAMSEALPVNDSTVAFTYELHQEAVWDDGRPVLATDVAFTIKAALNPLLKNGTWRGFFKNIVDLQIDPANPKKFSILVKKNYMLGQEMSGNYCLYPAHVYDPSLLMTKFAIPDLTTKDSAAWSAEEWKQLEQYATEYQSANFCKEKIQGCGAYRLKVWESGNRIVLERKVNWWGDSLAKDYPLLAAHPKEIQYLVIPDEAAAVVALKNKSIDLLSGISPKQYDELKINSADQFEFANPSLSQYYYLEINHRHPILKEKAVRQALAKLLDLDKFIQTQFNGLAGRIAGPVNPSKSYYNHNLKPVEFSPQEAVKLLTEAGWKDHNGDGILDKVIDGKPTELMLNLFISGKEIGKNIGILLQEEAAKVGIKIELISKESAMMMKDMNAHQFELATMAARQSPSLWDPYQAWHSSNAKTGGFNKTGFINALSDSLILAIRTAPSAADRDAAYLKFQELLYQEQAQIFLFAPLERMVYSRRLSILVSFRRPGYSENLIKLR
ncbi:MAG: hypothetical protein IPF46_00425 [Saprospiraceae bacterium]|nr:hypothetical protein [Candidatus Vicinibacter affinis]MBP6173541.1 hypothetical protein [Saprospiraceae bacterium]MBK6574146.1 hypothetical protein [Candidatus Vicinibacter affinis]MBK6823540.1 hypothetical protein [Candidatus Vicinibacter affinis]MBK7302392.1 hypothetical protein [Candidatus Vicinibacter affinis]